MSQAQNIHPGEFWSATQQPLKHVRDSKRVLCRVLLNVGNVSQNNPASSTFLLLNSKTGSPLFYKAPVFVPGFQHNMPSPPLPSLPVVLWLPPPFLQPSVVLCFQSVWKANEEFSRRPPPGEAAAAAMAGASEHFGVFRPQPDCTWIGLGTQPKINSNLW